MCLSFYGEERVTGNAHNTTLVTRWFGWRDKAFLSEVKDVPLHCEFETSENSLFSAEKNISLGREIKLNLEKYQPVIRRMRPQNIMTL